MLQITDACKTFSKGTMNEHTALDAVSLTLREGEFVTVIGSNGAGKSTLFNAIGGTFWLDRGTVVLEGQDITFLREHKRASMIGRLFQDPMKGSAPDMTMEENLALAFSRKKGNPLRIGVSRADVQLFRDTIARFGMGLEDRMKTKVGLLSGGQRQALSLLMSTIGKPRLLLLDEHTAALDPAAAEQVMNMTKEIVRENGLATMMITHNIQSALKTGTRTIMMDRGRIILDLCGEKREQMTVPRLMELYKRKYNAEFDEDRILLSEEGEA